MLFRSLPAAKLTAVFGSTEAEPIAHLDMHCLKEISSEEMVHTGLPLGHPDAAAEVRILHWENEPLAFATKAAFDARECTKGEAGEIIVKGAHVLQHYIGNPAAEARNKIRIGGELWHRTGDLGRMDASGNLYLLGRAGEDFVLNETRHYPLLVQYYLQEKTGVKDNAILFLNGEVVLVTEKSAEKHSAALNTALCAAGIAEARIVFLSKLPKDPRHQTKIDRERLLGLVDG